MAPLCKECHLEPQQKRKDRNSYRGYCVECERAKAREYQRKRREDNPDLVAKLAKEYTLMRQYNLTLEAYTKLVETQNNLCAICFATPEDSPMGILCVDHCHTTGKVRGLLCSRCNTAIGMLQDDPALLLRARDYVIKNKE